MGWSLSGCARLGFLLRTHPPVEQNENISWGCPLVELTPDDLRPVAAPLPQQQSRWLPWFHRGVHLTRLQRNTQLTRKSAGLCRLGAKHLLPWQWLSTVRKTKPAWRLGANLTEFKKKKKKGLRAHRNFFQNRFLVCISWFRLGL